MRKALRLSDLSQNDAEYIRSKYGNFAELPKIENNELDKLTPAEYFINFGVQGNLGHRNYDWEN